MASEAGVKRFEYTADLHRFLFCIPMAIESDVITTVEIAQLQRDQGKGG